MTAHPNPQYGRNATRTRHTGLAIRAYLGTCLWCRHGCFEGDDVTRGRGRWLGLLHTACHEKTRTSPQDGSVTQ